MYDVRDRGHVRIREHKEYSNTRPSSSDHEYDYIFHKERKEY